MYKFKVDQSIKHKENSTKHKEFNKVELMRIQIFMLVQLTQLFRATYQYYLFSTDIEVFGVNFMVLKIGMIVSFLVL